MKAWVSHNLCVGTGMCIYHAPKAFKLNQERLAEFVPDGGWTPDEVHEAADSCPMSAISIVEAAKDP